MPKGVGVQVPPSAHKDIALSSNGRTAAFGAVYRGSNPCGATDYYDPLLDGTVDLPDHYRGFRQETDAANLRHRRTGMRGNIFELC